jgi:predicted SAM-dependent methyltransferase
MKLVNELKMRKSLKQIKTMRDQNLCLEVGSGAKYGEGAWVTIDMVDECDIFWDLRRGLPFAAGSVSKIYSSHFLEHLSFKEAQAFLEECRRVLCDGGEFLVSVPNARLYIEAYVKGADLQGKGYFGHWPAYNKTTKIDYINYMASMDGHHRYMFDEENLLHILENKGFKEVKPRNFDPLLDPQWRDFESIYAVGVK